MNGQLEKSGQTRQLENAKDSRNVGVLNSTRENGKHGDNLVQSMKSFEKAKEPVRLESEATRRSAEESARQSKYTFYHRLKEKKDPQYQLMELRMKVKDNQNPNMFFIQLARKQ